MYYRTETPPPSLGHYSNIADDYLLGGISLATQRTVAVIPGAKHSKFGHNFIARTNTIEEITISSFERLLNLAKISNLGIPTGHEPITSIVDMNSVGDIAFEVKFVPIGTKLGDAIVGINGGSFVYIAQEQRAFQIDNQYQLIKLTDDSQVIVEKYLDFSLCSLRIKNGAWIELEYFVHSQPARIMFGSQDDWHLSIEKSGITDEFSDPFLRYATESPIRLDDPVNIQDMQGGLAVGIATPGGDANYGIGAYWFRDSRPGFLAYSELGLDFRNHMALPFDVAFSCPFGANRLMEEFSIVGGVTRRTPGSLFESNLRENSVPMLWRADPEKLYQGEVIEGTNLASSVFGDKVTTANCITASGYILASTQKHPYGALLVPN